MKPTWEEMWKIRGNNLPWVVDTVQPSLIKFVDILKPKKILEIGCGDGLNSNWLVTNGYNVTSIDVSESAIAIAKSKYPAIKQAFAQDIFSFNSNQHYDFVFDRGCLHGFEEPDMIRFVDKVYELLDNSGCWLTIAGMPTTLDNGPPQRSLSLLSKVIEQKLQIVSVNTVEILSKPNNSFPAWEIISKKN